MASMTGNKKASKAKEISTSGKDDLTTVVTEGATYTITDVKDGITAGFKNSSGLKIKKPTLLGFDQLTASGDKFNLREHVFKDGLLLETCYKCVTNSQEINRIKKTGEVQEIKISDIMYYIVPQIKPGAIKNAISYNRFMAICVSAIRVSLSKQIYSWEKHEYTVLDAPDVDVPDNVGNKLAMACGFGHNHDLHWFYAPGFEYTFEWFPIEVICCVMFKLAYKDNFKLNKLEDTDIVKNLAAQIGKKGQIMSVLESIGTGKIMEAYKKYNSEREEVMGVKRINDTLSALKELIGKLK